MLWRAARGGLLSRNALCRVPSIAPTANIPRPGPSPRPRSKGAGRCPRRGSAARAGSGGAARPAATGPPGRGTRRCPERLSELRPGNVPTNAPLERRRLLRTRGRPGGWVGLPLGPRTPGSRLGRSSASLSLAARSALLLLFCPREVRHTHTPGRPRGVRDKVQRPQISTLMSEGGGRRAFFRERGSKDAGFRPRSSANLPRKPGSARRGADSHSALGARGAGCLRQPERAEPPIPAAPSRLAVPSGRQGTRV